MRLHSDHAHSIVQCNVVLSASSSAALALSLMQSRHVGLLPLVTHCRVINSLLNSLRLIITLLNHEFIAAFASRFSSQRASPEVSCGKRHLLGPPGTFEMWVLLKMAKPAPGVKSWDCPGARPRRLSRNHRALAQLSESYTP